MTNMIQNAKDQAAALAMAAYKAAAADGTLPEAEVKTAPVEIPKDTANGDYTTTFALAAAKALGKPPLKPWRRKQSHIIEHPGKRDKSQGQPFYTKIGQNFVRAKSLFVFHRHITSFAH